MSDPGRLHRHSYFREDVLEQAAKAAEALMRPAPFAKNLRVTCFSMSAIPPYVDAAQSVLYFQPIASTTKYRCVSRARGASACGPPPTINTRDEPRLCQPKALPSARRKRRAGDARGIPSQLLAGAARQADVMPGVRHHPLEQPHAAPAECCHGTKPPSSRNVPDAPRRDG